MLDFNKELFADLLHHAKGDRSLNKFAAECGISASHLSRLMRQMLDTAPNPDILQKIADASRGEAAYINLLIACGYLNPNEQELHETISHIKEANSAYTADSYISIPVLETIKDGFDLYAEQQVMEHEVVPRDWVKGGKFFFLKVTENCMLDACIKDSCRVLVRRQNHVEDGKVALVIINGGEGTIKRVFYQDNGLVALVSLNSIIPPRACKPEEVKIQGQVVKLEINLK
jgi:SOS-response transcriptional repressor LexA